MIDLEKKLIESLERLYDAYLEKITNAKNNKVNENKISKDIEKSNEVLLKIISETEKEYTNEYNEALNIDSNDLVEELEKLESLKSIVSKRKSYIESFLRKNKKVSDISFADQFESIIKGDALEMIQRKIIIIRKYIDNNEKIDKLTAEVSEMAINIYNIENDEKSFPSENKAMENDLNQNINNVLKDYNLEQYDKYEIKDSYEVCKDLYFKLKEHVKKEKNNSQETMEELNEAKNDYEHYSTIYNLLQLSYMSLNSSAKYETCLEKRVLINSLLNNLKGHEVVEKLSPIVKEQELKLESEKRKIINKANLESEKQAKMIKLEQLKKENAAEEVVHVIEKFVSPEKIENKRVVGVIKNSIEPNAKNYGRIIIDASASEKAKRIVEINNQSAKSWIERVDSIINGEQEKRIVR